MVHFCMVGYRPTAIKVRLQVIWAAYTPARRGSSAVADPNSNITYLVQTCADPACSSGKAIVPGIPACLEHDCPSPTLLTLAIPALAPSDSVIWCAAHAGRPASNRSFEAL